jgi:hypothetical protein
MRGNPVLRENMNPFSGSSDRMAISILYSIGIILLNGVHACLHVTDLK